MIRLGTRAFRDDIEAGIEAAADGVRLELSNRERTAIIVKTEDTRQVYLATLGKPATLRGPITTHGTWIAALSSALYLLSVEEV